MARIAFIWLAIALDEFLDVSNDLLGIVRACRKLPKSSSDLGPSLFIRF